MALCYGTILHTMKTYQVIHGYSVYYESDEDYASYGLKYLSMLSEDEAEALFESTEDSGESSFEDENGYRFALLYVGGEYVLNSKN